MKIGDIVTIQPKALILDSVKFNQDDQLKILTIKGGVVVVENVATGDIHEVSKIGLAFVI